MKAKKVLSMALAVMLELSSIAGTGFSVVAAPAEEAEPVIAAEAEEAEPVIAAEAEEADEEAVEESASAADEEAASCVEQAEASEGEEQDTDVEEAVGEGGTTADGFTYEEISKGYRITGYTGSSLNLNIPDKIGDTYVAEIGERAFAEMKISSVTIPEHISTIGKGAFADCNCLTNVTINSRLLADTYSRSSDNKGSVFYNAGSQDGMTVTFGEGVEYIPAHLFRTYADESSAVYCRISKVVIADSVTEIGVSAFDKCFKLAELEGAAGVERIDNYAFSCTAFVSLPDFPSVTEIGEGAFGWGAKLKTAVLGAKTKKIGDSAFTENSKLEKVVLPASLTSLGKSVFKDDISLSELTINSKLLADPYSRSYDSAACPFYNAGSLDGMTVTFGAGVEYIPAHLFHTYEDESAAVFCKLNKVVIADSVTVIGTSAFDKCYKLAALEGAEGVETINDYAFSSTAFVSLPDFPSVTGIGVGAFGWGAKLKTAVLGAKTKTIGDNAFTANNKLEKVVLPASLTSLGKSVFKDDISLSEVTINSKLLADSYSRSYDSAACPFYNAGSLDGMTVTFGAGVEYIPAHLFHTYEDESAAVFCRVSKVVIADSVKKIGTSAFDKCYKLSELEGAAGVTEICNYAFSVCAFRELPDFPSVTDIDEGAFSWNGDMKTAVVSGKTQNIGSYVFYGNKKLEKVVLPLSLTSLGKSVFRDDIALKEVVINSKLIKDPYTNRYSSEDSVFHNAGATEGFSVVFGSSVEAVPAYLFGTYEDESQAVYAKVKSVEINSSLTILGDCAFGNCYMLDTIHFYGNAPKTIGENAFYSVEAKAYYPSNDKSWTDKVRQDYGGTITWVKENGSNVAVSGVTLNKSSFELGVGKSATLRATVTPANAANPDVSWSSSDTSVATVDNNGKVTGVAFGEAVITVTTVDGGKTASATCKVVEDPSGSDDEITLKGKKNAEITVSISFETNGADEVDSYYSISKSGKKAVLYKKMHKKGYTFKGWYLNGKKVSSLTAKTLQKNPDGITLEARFKPITYSIKYKVSKPARKVKVKGKIKLSRDEKKIGYEGGELTAKGTELSANGYVLKGWTNVKGGTEVVIGIGETLPLSELVPDSGKKITLYSIWEAVE